MSKKTKIKRGIERLTPILGRNTKQINLIMANIMMVCTPVIALLAGLSAVGFFEFGKTYTCILLFVGGFVCLTPRIFIRLLPDDFMKYYMMISSAVFIGIIGADRNIGVYITYVLVPVLSCLYFEPAFVLKISSFSYLVMIISVYFNSANLLEVVYQGRPRMQMFFAYAAGFTIEYLVVTSILYYLVRRAKQLVAECSNAESALTDSEKERQMFNALCIKYSAAYYCDLMTDYMEPVKQKIFSHASQEKEKMLNPHCYSEWIQHAFETFVIKEESPNYLEIFDAENLMRRLKTEKRVVYRHKTLPNGAGMEYFETTIVPLYRDKDHFKVIIGYAPIDDIVKEEKKNQEKLQIAYQTAENANKAKTTFLLNMSHDIRTPMNAILGYSNLMRGRLTDPELQHYQKMIEQSGNLLLSIINNVLDMARIESGEMELNEDYNEAGDIVSGVCSVFEMEAEKKNLTIEHIVNVEHPHIICDHTKMQEVLTNIISNAVKYTPSGGKITISSQELPCEQEGYIKIQTIVEDTGIGMSEEFLPHLFDSFTRERDTTTAKVAGTGLGMAIVKSLVDLMGGTIEVESKLGKGTKFTITVPHKIAPAEYYEKKTLTESIKADGFSGKRILMAEDKELNAEIAIAILEEMGFLVDHAEDGIVCVDKLEKASAGTYDLILMDVQMPNMDGYKATKVIRSLSDKKKAEIPIIAMTANAFAEDKKKALEMGMNGHIAKPIDVDKMEIVLLSILK